MVSLIRPMSQNMQFFFDGSPKEKNSSVYINMVTCQIIFMLFFAHYRANQMLGQLYRKIELDIDKIVHTSK